jgi:hypothetical protein
MCCCIEVCDLGSDTDQVLNVCWVDLLEHTPSSSPSCALVEYAVEAALRIAQKCDGAQGIQSFG